MKLTYNTNKSDRNRIFYFISLDNFGFHDYDVCERLNIEFEEYAKIMATHNAVFDDKVGYIFYDREDIENAIVSLKMLVNGVEKI